MTKYFLLVSILAVFSMIGTSFAITPVYYSEDRCDIDKDLKRYREILQDDIVVKTFMQKYPNATSFSVGGIDDSDPPQTSVHYVHKDNTSTIQLTMRIFGYLHDKSNCFAPFSYAIKYQDKSKTIQIINYESQTQEILDFLKEKQSRSPASILLHSSWSAFPIVMDQYQYYIPYKASGTSIGGMFPNCVIDSVLVPLDSSSDGKITIAIPRYVLDAKDDNNDADYIVILDDEEADFKEIQADSQFRILEIQTKKDSRNLEIIATSNTYHVKEPNCGIKKAPQYNILLTPIQQFKSGIQADDIICKKGLDLVIKSEHRHHPMCVKSSTKSTLIQRGLALSIRIAGPSDEILEK